MFSFDRFTEEEVFLFILCFTYNLNLLHIHKLYELSGSLFRSYLKAFMPMLRLSNKRLISLRLQAIRIHKFLLDNKEKIKESDLPIISAISKHLNHIYVCNNTYITLDNLEGRNLHIVYEDNSREFVEEVTREVLLNNKHIYTDGCVYTRTSPISFLLTKYFSDRNSREVLNLGLLDLHKEINGMREADEEEKKED